MLNFLGIGAQKCGTTWLYENLRKHPEIAFPGPVKELHFWDQQREKGIAWYRSLFEGNEPSAVKGEITPAYAILPLRTIEEIGAHFPDLKFLYMVRDPVERAWSAAKMHAGLEGLDPKEAGDDWYLEHFRSAGSRARGDYTSCLERWMEVYDPARFLVLSFDKIKSHPVELLNLAAEFLGADAGFYNARMLPRLREKIFSTEDYPLPSRLRGALDTLYEGSMERFESFIRDKPCVRF